MPSTRLHSNRTAAPFTNAFCYRMLKNHSDKLAVRRKRPTLRQERFGLSYFFPLVFRFRSKRWKLPRESLRALLVISPRLMEYSDSRDSL